MKMANIIRRCGMIAKESILIRPPDDVRVRISYCLIKMKNVKMKIEMRNQNQNGILNQEIKIVNVLMLFSINRNGECKND